MTTEQTEQTPQDKQSTYTFLNNLFEKGLSAAVIKSTIAPFYPELERDTITKESIKFEKQKQLQSKRQSLLDQLSNRGELPAQLNEEIQKEQSSLRLNLIKSLCNESTLSKYNNALKFGFPKQKASLLDTQDFSDPIESLFFEIQQEHSDASHDQLHDVLKTYVNTEWLLNPALAKALSKVINPEKLLLKIKPNTKSEELTNQLKPLLPSEWPIHRMSFQKFFALKQAHNKQQLLMEFELPTEEIKKDLNELLIKSENASLKNFLQFQLDSLIQSQLQEALQLHIMEHWEKKFKRMALGSYRNNVWQKFLFPKLGAKQICTMALSDQNKVVFGLYNTASPEQIQDYQEKDFSDTLTNDLKTWLQAHPCDVLVLASHDQITEKEWQVLKKLACPDIALPILRIDHSDFMTLEQWGGGNAPESENTTPEQINWQDLLTKVAQKALDPLSTLGHTQIDKISFGPYQFLFKESELKTVLTDAILPILSREKTNCLESLPEFLKERQSIVEALQNVAPKKLPEKKNAITLKLIETPDFYKELSAYSPNSVIEGRVRKVTANGCYLDVGAPIWAKLKVEHNKNPKGKTFTPKSGEILKVKIIHIDSAKPIFSVALSEQDRHNKKPHTQQKRFDKKPGAAPKNKRFGNKKKPPEFGTLGDQFAAALKKNQ
ncbi:MAG: hypothetical protein H7A33_03820 [Deltaproteobacteria bacterium]|nr:hypothetical protein [Deltaproteobacteria bacterium]